MQAEDAKPQIAKTLDRFVCPHPGCGQPVTIARVEPTEDQPGGDVVLHAPPACVFFIESNGDEYGLALYRSRS